jgi:CHASE2 domain-containing sensor protein
MKGKRKNIFVWFKMAVAAILSLALSWIFYIILDINVFDYLSKQDSEADVMNYYYSIENSASGEEDIVSYNFDDEIVIFDLESAKSRTTIADAIKKIETCHPKAVVLDIIFPKISETDSATDSYLSSVIASYKNIYAATRIADNQLERSFFAKETRIPEGLVNYTPYYRPQEILNGDTLQYMEYKVVGITGKPNEARMVNYTDKKFNTIQISQPFIPEDIENKIVLVGDLHDLRDAHDMPFPIGGKWRVSGTVLLAYALSTVIHDSWIVRWPGYVSAIIAALLTFLFTFFSYKMNENTRIVSPLKNFIIAFSRIIIIAGLMLVSYAIFSCYGKVLSPVYTIIALAFTGVSADIIESCGILWRRLKPSK